MRSWTTILVFCVVALLGCSGSSDGGGAPDTVTDTVTVTVRDAGGDAGDPSEADADVGATTGDADDGDTTDTNTVTDSGSASDTVTDTVTDTGTDSDTASDTVTDAAADTDTVTDAGTPCETVNDCLIAWGTTDPCLLYECRDGWCVVEPRENCCVDDVTCNDWDVCTVDLCDASTHVCVHPPSADPDCCAGEWLLQEDFDDGLPEGWSVEQPEGARAWWEVVPAATPPGQQVLRFHNPLSDTYGTGYHEWGTLWGPEVTLPAEAEFPIFRFDLSLDTEWRASSDPPNPLDPRVYDKLTVSLLVDGEEEEVWSSYSPDVEGSTCPASVYGVCEFGRFAFLLDAYRSRTVRPLIRFDSGDHIDNDYAGPTIDNLGLELACRLPGECLSSADCDDQDPCYDDVCSDGVCEHIPNYGSGCCYPYDQARWHFDPGYLNNFTVFPTQNQVRWHTSDLRSQSTPTSLRFGNLSATTYDDPGQPVAGYADSPPTTLSSYRRSVLSLWLWLDIEVFDNATPERDLFQIVLVDTEDDGETVLWDRSALAPDQYRTWVWLEIDLDEFLAQTVFFRFRFSSGDAEGNTGEGVFIDEIVVTRLCE